MKKVPYNPIVRAMNASRKSKRFVGRGARRAKDFKKSWKNEEV